ncbi:MAG TPA: enoyl-CoA hydratase-related protein [Gemmatimonadaceae bacterium]|jgi:2-(1,2-epoxy-1,2-dihydrophenyl)acetyl-CoA isomerase|nr:enoyl-CoA hydratase-related protein [Gemmatimonadaceae bacterium]
MASPSILVTSDDGVRTITLNRPERLNAIDPELADALPHAVDEASRADDVRVLVITGAGRGFCSGLDISAPPRLPESTRADRLDPFAWVGRWVMALVACEKPVIAAVNGVAAGAGFGLALAADIRLIASSARLTAGYVRRALSPDTGVSYLLPRLVGASRATEILFTGRDLDAAEAERIGLAAVVIPDEGFAEQVRAYATRLAAGPPIALALTKRLLASSFDAPLTGQLERELAYIKTCFASRDAAEALRAFSEKRPPIFSGE